MQQVEDWKRSLAGQHARACRIAKKEINHWYSLVCSEKQSRDAMTEAIMSAAPI
jgi:hypothetical protein